MISSWDENGGNPYFQILRSQFVTSKEDGRGGRRYLPYVFTEQGIAMLSSVLKNEIAVKVSIKIMESFVAMRKFFISNQEVFSRLDRVELKQLETDKKFEKVFDYIGTNTEIKQHIFFNGQFYDAFSCIVDIIEKAKSKITLIDNYVDTKTLNLLCKKHNGVDVIVFTAGKGKLTTTDINEFNVQYPTLIINKTTDFHDRFLIIDDKIVYHIGASLKDVGKKTFGLTQIEEKYMIETLLNRVSK